MYPEDAVKWGEIETPTLEGASPVTEIKDKAPEEDVCFVRKETSSLIVLDKTLDAGVSGCDGSSCYLPTSGIN